MAGALTVIQAGAVICFATGAAALAIPAILIAQATEWLGKQLGPGPRGSCSPGWAFWWG